MLLASLVALPADSASADGIALVSPAVNLVEIADGCVSEGCGQPISRREMAGWVVETLVDAGRAELEDHAGRFEDVDATDNWAGRIETFAALGITDGCSREPARFCPDRAVTRGQMAALLVRAFDLPEPVGDVRAFSDVADSHHFAYAIRRLASSGVTVGYPDGTFRPEAEVTRRHMATFLRRASAYSWGSWAWHRWAVVPGGCTATFRQSLSGAERTAAVPCSSVGDLEGRTLSVIGFRQRLDAWADAAACDRLRGGYFEAPPERVEVTAVTVAFDDLPAPGERYIAAVGAAPEQSFIDKLLAVVETKLEALSHGHTDWVFRRGGEVRLPGSAHSRASPVSLGRQALSGAADELSALFPNERLIAFHTATAEFPYTSFNSALYGWVSVVALEAEDDPDPLPFSVINADGRSYLNAGTWADIQAYRWSHTRFGWALQAAAHELLHQLGIPDTYAVVADDGRGPPDRDSGETSMMGLSSYGYHGAWAGEKISWDRGGGNLDSPSAEYPHEPFTGWNKWLLGWLDGPEAICVPLARTTMAVVRPHQHTILRTRLYSVEQQPCWALDYVVHGERLRQAEILGGQGWGGAVPNPAIAIIPTSSHTAVVIEADQFAAHGPPSVPHCFGLSDQLTERPPECPNAATTTGTGVRSVGDIIVYDVDLTASYRPLLMVNPTVAIVTPTKYAQLASLLGSSIGCYYTPEVTVHGYRITVTNSTVTADGLLQVTVTIEPSG